MCVYAMMLTWKSENSLLESILSFHYMGSRDQTHVIRLYLTSIFTHRTILSAPLTCFLHLGVLDEALYFDKILVRWIYWGHPDWGPGSLAQSPNTSFSFVSCSFVQHPCLFHAFYYVSQSDLVFFFWKFIFSPDPCLGLPVSGPHCI